MKCKSDTYEVIFQPSGKRGRIEAGTTIKEASIQLGVDIEGSCGAAGTCGKCRVKVVEGFFEKYAIESRPDHVSGPQENGCVLACQAAIQGDIVVFVPKESRLEKQVVRKDAGPVETNLNPAVKTYYIELVEASLDDTAADVDRIRQQLRSEYGLDNIRIGYPVLSAIQNTVREGGWAVTVFIWRDQEIIKISRGNIDDYYGLAIDIGTTTIAGYLCNLSDGTLAATVSMMNPQVVYGEDVMSRISYITGNDNGLDILQRSIIDGLNMLVSEACSVVNIPNDDLVDITVAGNTCMHHILLGINPKHLGKAPFVPAVRDPLNLRARDIGIDIYPGSYVYVLPLEAGFVGADNVAVLLSTGIHHRTVTELIIDIGTNGELVLMNGDRILSCSCATGPAFEGAEIRSGMRAVHGAIERISIDRETGETDYKVIGNEEWNSRSKQSEAKGICGSGIIDLLPQLFSAGIIDKTGKFTDAHPSDRFRVVDTGPEYVIAWSDETAIGGDITVCQSDVRAIQLAKAAMYAGAKLMMRKMGVENIDCVKLAGAFGNYIDRGSAASLGLFPDCAIEDVTTIGNAAGDGARFALLNLEKRKEADAISRRVEYLELTNIPEFERMFAEAMWIPHMKDDFPHVT